MKELDLVLMRYLQHHWPQADAEERAAFERVLELPDPVLAAVLLGRESAPEAGLQRVLDRVRGP
jgi:antitoxin CptB